LQAEIGDIRAKAGVYEGNQIVNEAKARLDMAKTDKLTSDKDLTDLQFLKENTNVDHQNRLEIEELKGRLNLLSMQYQKANGGKDEQIGVTK